MRFAGMLCNHSVWEMATVPEVFVGRVHVYTEWSLHSFFPRVVFALST